MGKGQETRQTIINAALAMASTDGLDKITIGQLATRLSMSKSGLFAHFKSKEVLQRALLEEAAARFVSVVISPALKKPRGIPRIEALFENWMTWLNRLPGGCVFLSATSELDDRPGALREHFVQSQRDWQDTLVGAAKIAVVEGHFRADLDCHQFAFEAQGLLCSHQHSKRLLCDSKADDRLWQAVKSLISRSR
jgi:AcrR family transcriptional regulator